MARKRLKDPAGNADEDPDAMAENGEVLSRTWRGRPVAAVASLLIEVEPEEKQQEEEEEEKEEKVEEEEEVEEVEVEEVKEEEDLFVCW